MSKENFIILKDLRYTLFHNILPTKRYNDDRTKIRINSSKQTVFNRRLSNTNYFISLYPIDNC